MFGFKELGTICLHLEQAAKSQDPDSSCRLATRIKDYLNTVEIVYSEKNRGKE